MDLSWRIKLRWAVCIGLVVVTAFVVLLVKEPAQNGPQMIAFAGWTNVLGVKNAMLVLPLPSSPPPKHNFLLKRTFRFELELRYVDDAGTETVTTIENGFGSGFPRGATIIWVPAVSGVRYISVFRAEGISGGYWDNNLFGWKPSSAPRSRTLCTFVLPTAIQCD